MRKMTVNGVAYLVTIGKSNVKIMWNGGSVAPGVLEVTGMDPFGFEKGQWKGNQDGMVTPKQIAKWIQNNL